MDQFHLVLIWFGFLFDTGCSVLLMQGRCNRCCIVQMWSEKLLKKLYHGQHYQVDWESETTDFQGLIQALDSLYTLCCNFLDWHMKFRYFVVDKPVGLCKQVPISSVFAFTVHFCRCAFASLGCYLISFVGILLALYGNWRMTCFSELEFFQERAVSWKLGRAMGL